MDIDAWAKKHGILFVNRSYGEYTTDTVSRDALADLARAERAEAAAQFHSNGAVERFMLGASIDGMDQTREFVLASDHDALVHDLEARCDPAGLVQENGLLRDQTRQLDAMVGRLKREAAQRVPLTAHQIDELWRAACMYEDNVRLFARAVEAARGIGAEQEAKP